MVVLSEGGWAPIATRGTQGCGGGGVERGAEGRQASLAGNPLEPSPLPTAAPQAGS